MKEPDEKDLARGRFGNVVQAADLPERRWGHDTGRYGASGREAALAVGARDLGYSVVSLDPGRRSCPYHFHHSEEEVFYVLEGTAILRQGDAEGEEELPIGPGDFVAFPAGTGIGHQFINRGEGPFVYLAMSNRLPHDVAEYPDSDKILIRSKRLMLRRQPTLEYFDGEV